MSIFWSSPNQLNAFRRCPEAWHDRYILGVGENIAGDGARYGLSLHTGIESFLMGGHISSDTKNASEQDGLALAARFCETWDQFPPKDMRICVEQHGIPAKYRADKDTVSLMGIELIPGIGLRCRLDLAYISDAGAFSIDDWSVSTKPPEEAAIQAACNVIVASEVWKGFPEYRVRHIDVHRPHAAEWMVFSPADIQAAKAEILALIKTMLGDQVHAPTINRYCGTCHRRDTCPAYVSALTVDPVKSMVAKLSMHRLEQEDNRIKGYSKLLADYRDEISAEMESRVLDGPVAEGQDEWYLGERAGNRKWAVEPVAQLAVAALESKAIDLDQFSALFSVVASGVDGLKKSAPDLHAQVNALAVKTPTPIVKKRPAQVISIEEVAPIELPAATPLCQGATGADAAETPGVVPGDSSPCVAPAGANTGHSVLTLQNGSTIHLKAPDPGQEFKSTAILPPALAAVVEDSWGLGDLPPVDTSDLPIISEYEPWHCPNCGFTLRPVATLAPLRGHTGLSCEAHGVVAWTKGAEYAKAEDTGKLVEEIPFSEPLSLCGYDGCEFHHSSLAFQGKLGWEHEYLPDGSPRRRIAKGYRGESLAQPWRKAATEELAAAKVARQRRPPPPEKGADDRKNWLVAEIAKKGEQSVAALCSLPIEELERLATE